MDEPGAVRSTALRFQQPSDLRIRLLRAWDGNIRGKLVALVTVVPRSHHTQVLTGLRPFHHILACTPVPAILRGERPTKPLDAETLGFSDTLWGLVQSCWSESSSTRPTAQRLLNYLSFAALTWVPPPIYPTTVVDGKGITDSDSSSLWRIFLENSAREA